MVKDWSTLPLSSKAIRKILVRPEQRLTRMDFFGQVTEFS
jgi:hypothetical protein